ncbi:MAG: dephospho-CoA kinase [Alphaproteobacteria bacterium]
MIVIGLTGSIGMGKSTAARALRRLRVPVFEADREVQRLLAEDRSVKARIAAQFPDASGPAGTVDHGRLADIVFHDPPARRKLETILHPLVRRAEWRFLRQAAAGRQKVVALDMPLLFETGAHAFCDVTVVVSAPPFVQEARVLKRANMTRERFTAIRANQMPDAEKRRRAHVVVPTGAGQRTTLNRLRRIVTLARAYGENRPAAGRKWLRLAHLLSHGSGRKHTGRKHTGRRHTGRRHTGRKHGG